MTATVLGWNRRLKSQTADLDSSDGSFEGAHVFCNVFLRIQYWVLGLLHAKILKIYLTTNEGRLTQNFFWFRKVVSEIIILPIPINNQNCSFALQTIIIISNRRQLISIKLEIVYILDHYQTLPQYALPEIGRIEEQSVIFILQKVSQIILSDKTNIFPSPGIIPPKSL